MPQAAKLDGKGKSSLFIELSEAIGSNKVKDDENVILTYSYDSSPVPSQKPLLVVFPENSEHVKAVLKICNTRKVPIAVMAYGVNAAGGCIPVVNGIVLDLRRMDKIREINTDSGYAVIEAGVNFDSLTSALAEIGYRCQIPAAPGGTSVIANYLLRPSGNFTTKHLDPIVDLEVVFPDGSLIRTGSSHFPDIGSCLRYGPFPDVTGLFCCSQGTLGVITRAAVRIYPINEARDVILVAFDKFEGSSNFVKDVINNNIPEHCFIWHWHLYRTDEIEYGTDGVPEVPPELLEDPFKPPEGIPYNIVNVLVSGYKEWVATAQELCQRIAPKYGGKVITKQEAEKTMPGSLRRWTEYYCNYHQVMDKNFAFGRYFPYLAIGAPQDIIELEPWALKKLDSLGVRPCAYYAMPFDFGRSMFFRIFIYPDPDNEELLQKTKDTMAEITSEALKRYRAIPFRYRRGWQLQHSTGDFLEFLRKIKSVLDPNNILNPQMGMFE